MVSGLCTSKRCRGLRRVSRKQIVAGEVQEVCDFCRDRYCEECEPTDPLRCIRCTKGYELNKATGFCQLPDTTVTFEMLLLVVAIFCGIVLLMLLCISIPLYIMRNKRIKRFEGNRQLRECEMKRGLQIQDRMFAAQAARDHGDATSSEINPNLEKLIFLLF